MCLNWIGNENLDFFFHPQRLAKKLIPLFFCAKYLIQTKRKRDLNDLPLLYQGVAENHEIQDVF